MQALGGPDAQTWHPVGTAPGGQQGGQDTWKVVVQVVVVVLLPPLPLSYLELPLPRLRVHRGGQVEEYCSFW